MPLKPLPELVTKASSSPGPLEESYLRNQEDAVRSPELASEQQSISALSGPHSPAQQPPNSRQPVSASSAGIQQGACSSSKAMGHSAAIGEREAAEETSRTHNAYETPSTGRASAEKLGPNFGKLLATFQQRKSRSGEALTPQSDPGSAASKFSASLAVLQARSGHAMQRSSRRTSENTVTSTAATRHSRTHLDPGANAPSKQKAQDAAQAAVSSASKAACDSTAKSTHLKQQNSSGQEPPRPQAGPSFRAPAKDATTYPSAGASQQLAGAAAGPKLQQKAPIQSMRPGVGGRTSTPRCVLAIGQARVRCKGAEACDEHSAAAWAVTPADISAEASDLAIRRQLGVILMMLSAVAALFLACCVLLVWRLCPVTRSGEREAAPGPQGTDYALLSPFWNFGS